MSSRRTAIPNHRTEVTNRRAVIPDHRTEVSNRRVVISNRQIEVSSRRTAMPIRQPSQLVGPKCQVSNSGGPRILESSNYIRVCVPTRTELLGGPRILNGCYYIMIYVSTQTKQSLFMNIQYNMNVTSFTTDLNPLISINYFIVSGVFRSIKFNVILVKCYLYIGVIENNNDDKLFPVANLFILRFVQ